MKKRQKLRTVGIVVSASVAIILLFLNFISLVTPPLDFQTEQGVFKNDVWYSYEDFIDQKENIENLGIKDSLAFAKSMMDLVSGRFLHKWNFSEDQMLML